MPVPKVANTKWPRNEIDRFILARLEKSPPRKPSPEADRVRWLRRVSLMILTGLPPTPGEVDAFLADKSPTAYEHVVDRLLGSKHFGERMAVPWLDAARYADSYGYQSDQLCPTWPYRDWVVQAFNDNLPYDQFLTEQLAGDLLPHATRRQRLATAFNRLHRQTNEGGSIEEEWRNEYIADRVQTFSTTFLGLTFECARCHDHKFDPILQRDYYSLSAFFNSIDEYGLYNDTSRVPTPSILLPTPAQEKAIVTTDQALNTSNKNLGRAIGESEASFQDWLKGSNLTAEIPGLTAHFSFERTGDATINSRTSLIPNRSAGRCTATRWSPAKPVRRCNSPAMTNSACPSPAWRFQPWGQYTILFWLRIPQTLTNAVVFHVTQGTDVGFYGVELSLDEGRLFFVLKRFWPGNAIADPLGVHRVPTEQWVQIGVTFDGSGQAEGMNFFVDGKRPKSDRPQSSFQERARKTAAAI